MHFRKSGIRFDDDLTNLQQQEKEDLADDFQRLKTKGHKPFVRKSESRFYFDDCAHSCMKGQAHKADAKQSFCT